VQPLGSLDAVDRARWGGRLAAVFFVASGLLGVLTLPLLPADADLLTSAVITMLAAATGLIAWVVPWQRLPAQATLVLLLPGFMLIAASNAAGGSNFFGYSVFFFVVFAWLGMIHPPGTSLAALPIAAVAYVAPLFAFGPSERAAGLAAAVVALPVCCLVGETLARSIDRAVAIDIELRKERAQAEYLRKIDRMRDTFLRAASHELRTPITICRGHLEVLDADAPSNEVDATRGLVLEELARMQRLVDDLTALSRLEDPTRIRRRPVDVEDLIRSVAVKAEAVVGHAVDVRVEDVGRVPADRQRLEQALLGLVQNVHDHAGPGAKVTLAAERDHRSWRFDVVDDGVGLASGTEETAFQPFEHGPASPGTGLGLAIVRAIARAHGGEATAKRRRPDGTVVSVRIPA
jgi:signal transduction histidine kinase